MSSVSLIIKLLLCPPDLCVFWIIEWYFLFEYSLCAAVYTGCWVMKTRKVVLVPYYLTGTTSSDSKCSIVEGFAHFTVRFPGNVWPHALSVRLQLWRATVKWSSVQCRTAATVRAASARRPRTASSAFVMTSCWLRTECPASTLQVWLTGSEQWSGFSLFHTNVQLIQM